MEKQWNYVAKDGNPTKEGEYWVTLIWPEWKDRKKTGRILAEVTTRWFGEADEWAMDGQPKEGLVWSQECGSVSEERVLAWMEIDEPAIASELPDNAEVVHTRLERQEVGTYEFSFEEEVVGDDSEMQVTVFKENYTIKDDWIKIGTFEDLHHPMLFIKSVLDQCEEDNTPVRLSIEFKP